MPRSVDFSAELSRKITRPFKLIYIGFSTPLYISTGGTVSFDGQTWTKGTASVDSIDQGDAAMTNGSITLLNSDNSISAFVLSEGARDKACKIYEAYLDTSGLLAGTPELVFSGVMDGVNITPEHVRINIQSYSEAIVKAPRYFCGPPLMNHVPPDGTIVQWGNDKYTLERG